MGVGVLRTDNYYGCYGTVTEALSAVASSSRCSCSDSSRSWWGKFGWAGSAVGGRKFYKL